MSTFIALIRGINVGGKHIVRMKELVTLLESNGYINVRTYIQSGNVIFQVHTKPELTISELIENRFGFKPSVLILSADEFKKSLAQNPFNDPNGKTIHFFFLEEEPKSINDDLLNSLKAETEDYKLIGKIFYL